MRSEIKKFRKNLPPFFPHELREMRLAIFLTQAEAAYLCRVSVQAFRAWEYQVNVMSDLAWAYWIIQWNKVASELKSKYQRARIQKLYEKEEKIKRARLSSERASV